MSHFLKNKITGNAAWIVGCKAVQAVFGLLVSMVTARYLGPENYGLLNYAASLTVFITPLAQLGFTAILVHDFVKEPEKEGEILGTAILTASMTSILCILGLWGVLRGLSPEEPLMRTVCILYSLMLLTQSVEFVQYWFQAKLQSKYPAIFTLGAYLLLCLAQLLLVATKRGVLWFAPVKSVQYALTAVGLLWLYRKKAGSRLSFSVARSTRLIRESFPYMLAALLVMAYSQADRIMIRAMLGDTEVGYYSAAIFCANLTEFVFLAVIDSMRPLLLQERGSDASRYELGISALYSLMLWFSLAQSLVFTLLAPLIVRILYGAAYLPSVGTLRIIVWYTAFSVLGSARTVWIQAEGKQRYLWTINLFGALSNIALNALLIPRWGIDGAAFASLLTQMLANVGTGFVFRPLRRSNTLLLRALNPKVIVEYFKSVKA